VDAVTVTAHSPARLPSTHRIDGEVIAIPVEVRSARMVAAQFGVDADAAQALIEPTGLRIARQAGGRALCALSAVAYADNDLGPYHEFAVAFVVDAHDAPPGARPSWRRPTTYIHRLPVNQQFTCRAGREIWGFPKWVCDISYLERDRGTESVVADSGELVLGLEVRRGLVPLPETEMEMTAYSWNDGVLRRTPWTTRNRLARARPGGARLELGHGHPMADELRSLGLPKRALMTTSTGLMSATFGPAEVVTR
jgi:hypothetical protein